MPPKRAGRGRPAKDDEEAIREVWRLRRENPRIGYREAARRYFQEHPEKLTAKLESEARRVGDKAGEHNRGIPTQSEWKQLLSLQRHLIFGIQLVNDLLGRWKKRPKADDVSPAGRDRPVR